MSVYDNNSHAKANRVFLSYSSIDRVRTNGLALLLEAMGHRVFHDHRTIKPGRRWKAALQDGLDDADAVMVFWTKHAARSDWVRKEYEYFAAQFPDRLLIPVVGDETPLTEILKTRQQADFVPVVNEVLELKRKMKKEGAEAGQIEQAVRERLGDEGVDLKTKHQKRLLFLFLGFGWLLTLLRYPGAWFQKAGNGAVEKVAQASAGQMAVIALAALVGGGLAYPTAKSMIESDLPADIAELNEQNRNLRAANNDLAQRNEELMAADDKLDDVQTALAAIRDQIAQLPTPSTEPVSCVSPQEFAACEAGISDAKNALNNRLTGISQLLGRMANEPGPDEPEPPVSIEILESSTSCDTGLEPLVRVEPVYPARARAQQLEEDVIVRATIDADGIVTDAVAESEADVALTNAAVEAMRNWTFTRCTVDGNPTPATHRVKFKFRIPD